MLSPSQKKTSGSAAVIARKIGLLRVELVARAGAEREAEGRRARGRRVRRERRQAVAVRDAVDQHPVVIASRRARVRPTVMRTVKSLAAPARTGALFCVAPKMRIGRVLDFDVELAARAAPEGDRLRRDRADHRAFHQARVAWRGGEGAEGAQQRSGERGAEESAAADRRHHAESVASAKRRRLR